ncbi:unnamed protein product [marine sediment metagenome]|uniref:Uncharacterized protein n=1 Tax=marine sediment metagenome TaxID=412755 RepID=X1RHF5_9ZZZZ
MPINGTPPIGGWEREFVYWKDDGEVIPVPTRELKFCSNLCAWRYGMGSHKQMGMSGKEAREHLIEVHSLTEPGKR